MVAIFDQIDIKIKSFLDCHQNIVFRGTEPRYFLEEKVNRRILRGNLRFIHVDYETPLTTNIRFIISYNLAWRTRDAQLLHVLRHVYTNNLPRSAWDEILIEKSPQAGF